MIFSCTKKVLDKVKKHRPVEATKMENGFYNWYVDLINIERKNYFLFTHSQTLFSFFLYAGTKTEILNLENLFAEKLEEMIIREIGISEKFYKALLPENANYLMMKTNSRKVLGSMNEFKYQIEILVDHHGPLSQTYEKINHLINTVLMGTLNYECPKDAMKLALEGRLN